MSNIVPFDNIQVPAHFANRVPTNDIFASGMPGGFPPQIALNGTRFVSKVDGVTTPINTLELSAILISAKPTLDKTYYAGNFDPNNTEARQPDCFSTNGQTPDPSAVCKQHTNCAACPMNAFGSGVDAAGNPSKGKACKDSKTLAIFAAGTVYSFKIPPASFRNFGPYVKMASNRGVDLSTGITLISFDPNFSYPVLSFNFGGFLSPEQAAKIDALKNSQEVLDIIGAKSPAAPAPAPQQIATPVAPTLAPVVAEPVTEISDPFAAPVQAVPAPEKKPRAPRQTAAPAAQAQPVATDSEADALARELGLL